MSRAFQKSFSGRQAQTNPDVNTFSENNALEFLFGELAQEVLEAHLTAKVKNFFRKITFSALFVNDTHCWISATFFAYA